MPTSKHVLDAHTVVWYLEDNPRLAQGAIDILTDPNADLYLPIIALAEVCWVVEHGRTKIPTVSHLLMDVRRDARIKLVPLDEEIVRTAFTLPAQLELHDRLIVASALHLDSPDNPSTLVTNDRDIRDSALVRTRWET